jgi:hypothetical protein
MGKIKKGKQKAADAPQGTKKLEGVVEVIEEDDDGMGGLGQYINPITS